MRPGKPSAGKVGSFWNTDERWRMWQADSKGLSIAELERWGTGDVAGRQPVF